MFADLYSLWGAYAPIIVPILLFGALTGSALWVTWTDRDLMWVGIWLLVGFLVSNILHFTVPVTTLSGPYSLIETMVLLAASLAWDNHRSCWQLLVLGGVNVLSICANIAFAATFPPSPRQIYAFELTTNLCFATECLLAIMVGFTDGCRNGRFSRLPRFGRRAVAPNAARSQEGEAR